MRRLDTIDLRLLRVFVALVDAGGFAGAQIALNLSQSTLSTHLAELEKRVGGSLCTRGRRAFRLTDLGGATYAASKKLFLDIDDFRHAVGAAKGRLTGRIRVGIVDGVITSPELCLQRTVERLLSPEVDIALDVFQGTPLDLETAAAEGQSDVVIGPFAQRVPGLVYRPIYLEDHLLYCGKAHPLFSRPDATITHAVVQKANISVRGYRQMDDLYRIGQSQAQASVMQMEAQTMMILSGRFIGFLPCHIAQPWIATGAMRAVRPTLFHFTSQHFVAYRRGADRRPIIGAFLRACMSTVQRTGADLSAARSAAPAADRSG